MPVRRASMGWLFLTRSRTWIISSGMRRLALNVASKSANCWLLGSVPYSSK